MARDLREDAARAVVQEAQQAAEPGPTLAEMVTELRRLFPGGSIGSPNAHLLIGALAEIDRRLTALEDSALRIDPNPPRALAPRALALARTAVGFLAWLCVFSHDRPCAEFVIRPGRVDGEGCYRCGFSGVEHHNAMVRRARPAIVPGHDAPCTTFVRHPGSAGCGRCGFAEDAHG